MAESFDLPSVDAVTFGTVGQPGQRVFYVQAWAGQTAFTLKLEKQQVAGLATAFRAVLADQPGEASLTGAPGLRTPIEPDWIVGAIGIGVFDQATQRITVAFHEAVAEDEEGATAEVGLTTAQLVALVERGDELLAGGRPNCELCGTPMDPDGHSCPKTNGHLKH